MCGTQDWHMRCESIDPLTTCCVSSIALVAMHVMLSGRMLVLLMSVLQCRPIPLELK